MFSSCPFNGRPAKGGTDCAQLRGTAYQVGGADHDQSGSCTRLDGASQAVDQLEVPRQRRRNRHFSPKLDAPAGHANPDGACLQGDPGPPEAAHLRALLPYADESPLHSKPGFRPLRPGTTS